jgi:hypothetical protein
MISTCLSIVQDSFSDYFSVAITSFLHQKSVCASFQLDGKSKDPSARYADIWMMLDTELSDPQTTQVIIALPTVLEVMRVDGIPILALAQDYAIYMKLLLFLKQKAYCTFIQKNLVAIAPDGTRDEICLITPSSIKPEELAANEGHLSAMREQAQDVCRHAGREIFLMDVLREGFADPPPHKLLLFNPSAAKSYAQFLFGSCPSLTWAAIAASLVAQNAALYYYLTSRGVVQSSQDIVEFLQQVASGVKVSMYKYPGHENGVISAEELYTTKAVDNLTKLDKLDQVPLKYVVALQKYQKDQRINQREAQRFAFLTICKMWNIRLYCQRMLFDYLFRRPAESSGKNWEEENLIFDPQQPVLPWVLDALHPQR